MSMIHEGERCLRPKTYRCIVLLDTAETLKKTELRSMCTCSGHSYFRKSPVSCQTSKMHVTKHDDTDEIRIVKYDA